MLSYTVAYAGLTGVPLHHGDAKHTTTAPTVPFTSLPGTTSGSFSGTVTLPAMRADSLQANRPHANRHTAANGNGELRADLSVK